MRSGSLGTAREAAGGPPGAQDIDSGIRDSALRLGGDGPSAPARLLTRFAPDPAASRREVLASLNHWARGAGFAVAVVPTSAGPLFADFRALGFDDAGPMPRYFAPARPPLWRRFLTETLLPAARVPDGLQAIPKTLSAANDSALRDRFASGFGALAEAEADPASAGITLLRGGEPVAGARWRRDEAGTATVTGWLAPPGEADLAAVLAGEALRTAAAGGAAGIRFETSHAVLGRGLLLARFLPRKSRARILVRQGGARDLLAPKTAGWHLTAPARIRLPPGSPW